MTWFLKSLAADGTGSTRATVLGHLEINVMEFLWSRGESSVRDVNRNLNRKLAYTTVMTTLDRLFKKGLLKRRKLERAYVYSPVVSQREWEETRARDLVTGFFSAPPQGRELLVSCFLEAVGQHDPIVLNELEKKIQMKRKELIRRRRST